jgi:hypothetical protein
MDNTKDEDTAKKNAETTSTAVKMDINRYLHKKDYGKSISNMLRVLFKGQLATETEWDEQAQAVITRKAD